MPSRKNRKRLSKKRGGWSYKSSKSPTSPKSPRKNKGGKSNNKPLKGGNCGCAASKFFSGGSANLDGAKNVIPMSDYSNDPQRMLTIGNLPQTGGRRRTMRKNRKTCKKCGKMRGGVWSLYGSPNAISSFATSPDMNNVTNLVFKTQSMTNPSVYKQDSAIQSTMV